MSDSDEKTPVEQAVEHAFDLFVYAPIGLLFEGATLLPELVAKGKSQVTMARMLGKFAVDEAQKQATQAVSKLQDQAAGVIDFLGDTVTPVPADHPPAGAAAPPKTQRSRPTLVRPVKTAAANPSGDGHAVDVATLAIPDYDGLSASQVVNRLAGLSPTELESVQGYEAAHRGRKTILSKVSQLQGH